MKLIRKLWHLFCRTPQATADPSGFLAASWLRMVNNRAYGLDEEPKPKVTVWCQLGATKNLPECSDAPFFSN